ncbi:hypothetical protein [Nautilia sp.]
MYKASFQTKINPYCAKEITKAVKKYQKTYRKYADRQINISLNNLAKTKKEEKQSNARFWGSVNDSVNKSFKDANRILRKTTNSTNKFTNGGKETPVDFDELTEAEKAEYMKNHPLNTNSQGSKEMIKCVAYKLFIIPLKYGKPENLWDKYAVFSNNSAGTVLFKNEVRNEILFKKGYGIDRFSNQYFYTIIQYTFVYEKNAGNCVPKCSSYHGQYCPNYDVMMDYLEKL